MSAADEVREVRRLVAEAEAEAAVSALPDALPPVLSVTYSYDFPMASGPVVPGSEPGTFVRLDTVDVTEFPNLPDEDPTTPLVNASGPIVNKDGRPDRRRTYRRPASHAVDGALLALHRSAVVKEAATTRS